VDVAECCCGDSWWKCKVGCRWNFNWLRESTVVRDVEIETSVVGVLERVGLQGVEGCEVFAELAGFAVAS
jgi:hypothetical protein